MWLRVTPRPESSGMGGLERFTALRERTNAVHSARRYPDARTRDYGQLAQRESTDFTRRGSLVRSQYCPQACRPDHSNGVARPRFVSDHLVVHLDAGTIVDTVDLEDHGTL